MATTYGPDGRVQASDEFTTKSTANNRLRTNRDNEQAGAKLNQNDINNNRVSLGRGMADGGDPYLNSQLGQIQAVQDAAPDASYRGVKEGAFQGMAADAMGRGAILADYTAANQQRGLGMESRGSMADALRLARDAAMGNGPSAAQAQLQQGTDAAARMAMAQAAGARGGMARAGAQRMGAMAASGAVQNAAAGAAALRAQEMNQARGMYGSFGQALASRDLQAQGLDANMGQFQAQMMQQGRNANDSFAAALMGLGQRSSVQEQEAAQRARDMFNQNFMQSQQHKNNQDSIAAGLPSEAKQQGLFWAGLGEGVLNGGLSVAKAYAGKGG